MFPFLSKKQEAFLYGIYGSSNVDPSLDNIPRINCQKKFCIQVRKFVLSILSSTGDTCINVLLVDLILPFSHNKPLHWFHLRAKEEIHAQN